MKSPKLIQFLFPLGIIAFILANFYFVRNSVLGSLLGFIFIYKYGFDLGRVIFPRQQRFFQTLFGILTLLGGITIFQWFAFYVYQINHLTFAGSLIFSALTIEFLKLRHEWDFTPVKISDTARKIYDYAVGIRGRLFIATYIIIYIISLFLVISAQSAGIIASPWQLIPHFFFAFFGVLTVLLILITYLNRNNKAPLVFFIAHTFLMSGVALIVYQLGYGYDPFLHLAAEKVIDATGTLAPKTFYYIGEYSLILFLKNLTQLSLDTFNRALLPILFSVFLPTSLYYFFQAFSAKKRFALTAGLLAFTLPLTYFINTTPQGLTNLLCLVIILLSFLVSSKQLSIYYLFFLTLLTCTIHPLYGVPIGLFVLFTWLRTSALNAKLKIVGQCLVGLISIVVFPILFLGNSLFSANKISLGLANIHFEIANLFQFKKMYIFLYDLLYVYGYNFKLIYLIFAVVAIIVLWRFGKLRFFRTTLLFAGIFLSNYFITKFFVNLSFVINQDKELFLNRILELAFYFLLPAIVYAGYLIIKKSFQERNNYWGRIFILFSLVLLLTMSFYFSYPVFDNYKNSKEYNVTRADLDSVHYIQDNARGDYIVLANQMVAAAAIREFGFEKYYNGNFYYSIPTGNANNIYDYYKKMVFEEPKKENAIAAMNVAGVNQAYFIVNKYWTNFPKIVERAKLTANSWQSIDDGENYIFFYTK
jgi:hypothetical protein